MGRRTSGCAAGRRASRRVFDELRTGFTAAVSHELRTPLARILVLLDSADLPGADVDKLIEQARAEVEHAGALIDEILFLSELESGRRSSRSAARTRCPCSSRSSRGRRRRPAGVTLQADGRPEVDLPLRPRMLRIVAENLTENAIRYAGHGATFRLDVAFDGGRAVLDGRGRRNWRRCPIRPKKVEERGQRRRPASGPIRLSHDLPISKAAMRRGLQGACRLAAKQGIASQGDHKENKKNPPPPCLVRVVHLVHHRPYFGHQRHKSRYRAAKTSPASKLERI